MTAAEVLPWLLMALPAGALVDRLPPRTVLTTAHGARAALTAALVTALLTDVATVPVLCPSTPAAWSGNALVGIGLGTWNALSGVRPVHDRGRVLADAAVMIADGVQVHLWSPPADCLSLGDDHAGVRYAVHQVTATPRIFAAIRHRGPPVD